MEISLFLNNFAKALHELLGDNLVGVYLHGSLAMGCFNPKRSDIDLLVVAKNPLQKEEQKSIARQALLFHEDLPNRCGLEFCIVLESAINHFVFPTPFEFHYSDFHREKYASDENYICCGLYDPDLAAHFTVTYHRGSTVLGKPLKSVFEPVERTYYVRSIIGDIAEAITSIIDSPVNYTLNLCRVLMYLRAGKVSSKKEGGEWGMKEIPQFSDVISQCLDEYIGEEVTGQILDNVDLVRFAAYMLKEIHGATDQEAD